MGKNNLYLWEGSGESKNRKHALYKHHFRTLGQFSINTNTLKTKFLSNSMLFPLWLTWAFAVYEVRVTQTQTHYPQQTGTVPQLTLLSISHGICKGHLCFVTWQLITTLISSVYSFPSPTIAAIWKVFSVSKLLLMLRKEATIPITERWEDQ